jgi:uncharacterized protein YrrD
MIMLFNKGADVFTADGNQVGSIDRVVIDPYDDEVTHLVVNQGFLFTEDKVLPVDWISEANEDRITLRPDIEDLDRLPKYEETHYMPRHEEDPVPRADGRYAYRGVAPMYPYPHFGIGAWPTLGAGTEAHTERRTHRNIPHNTEALQTGAKVFSSDDKHVGEIESVLMDERDNQVSHFVIAQGFFFKDRKLVPVTWVRTLMQDEVHLGVGSGTLDQLPEYNNT